MKPLVLHSVFLLVLLAGARAFAEETPQALLQQAHSEFQNGKTDEALALAEKAVAAAPKEPGGHVVRAQIFSHQRKYSEAIAEWDEAAKLAPSETRVFQLRGCDHFRAGQFKESIADFDKYIEAFPDQAAHHWQRGISCYYAEKFADGRKQFELHKTVNPEDVENAAWHYLCVARIEGVEKARAALIEVGADSRVPMKEIFALFKGIAKPDDVLAAAKAGNPPPAQLKEQLFYAHLYLGLYYEAAGSHDLVREHIFKAADDFSDEGYMGDVARVHAAVLRKK